MNNSYDFIKVDPRVIHMLGGDETDVLKEGLDSGDLSNEELTKLTEETSSKSVYDDLFSNPPELTTPVNTENTVTETSILTQILEELKEIKTILAGKE